MFDNDSLPKALSNQIAKDLHKTPCVLKAIYDFSTMGGATGDISLVDDFGNPALLPKSAIVTKVLAYVVTAVTSGGSATVALKAATAADLMAATAKASLGAAAYVDGVPVWTAATAVGPLAAITTVKATVAVAALTAGKIQFFIHYVIS